MEGLEDGVTRPRQVRYQAALRPDCIHSTPLPVHAALRDHWVLIQRTCFSGEIPQNCIKTQACRINDFRGAIMVDSDEGGYRPTLDRGVCSSCEKDL
jgi:hypothetical protein